VTARGAGLPPELERVVELAAEMDAAGHAHADWPEWPDVPVPPRPDPLPVDVLPPALRAHVLSVAAATQTPPDMAVMLSIAAVSAALRGVADVHVDARGWREVATIYTAIVLPPATRKSPVYAHMIAPIEAWERDALERVAPDYRRALDRVELAREALRHVRAQAARGKATRADVEDARAELDAAEAAVPPLPRVLAADATPEALVRLMHDVRAGIAVMAPEADPLAIADGRYSDTARVDELLRCWSAEPIRMDRIAREPLRVDRPVLTLAVCVQPAALEALQHARVHRGRGVWGRVLWCVPPHGLGTRLTGADVPALDAAAAERYARVLRRLLDAADADVRAGRPPRTLRLSPEALDEIYAFEAEVEAELHDEGALASIRDHAGKIVGQAVRLAALLELAARAEDGGPLWEREIGRWAAAGGVRLARALLSHARHVLATAGVDRALADLRYVLRRLVRLHDEADGEPVTLRDLLRACDGRPGIADAPEPAQRLREIVRALEARGCVRMVERRTGSPGRPPSPLLELHPALRGAAEREPVAPREVAL